MEDHPGHVLQRHGFGEVGLPRLLTRGAALGLALSVVAACGTASDKSPATDSSRIVALSGDLTEFVYEVGAGDRLVGVDVTTVFPPPALELPVVGIGRFITAEGVLGVDPTLVLADTQTSPPEALSQMRGAGVSVEILPIATSFDAMYDKIETLGRLLEAEDQAEALIDRISADVDSARSETSGTNLRVAYIYTRGPDVMLLFGHGMTTQPLIEAAGAVDAGADSGVVDTIPVTAEALVAAAPDVIIVPEEGLEILGGLDVFLETPGVSETPAGRNRAILAYPEGDILTFGPRIVQSLRKLVTDLDALAG